MIWQGTITSNTSRAHLSNGRDAAIGCGGSKDDIFKSDNLVKLSYFAECSKRPADLNDPQIDKLCQ